MCIRDRVIPMDLAASICPLSTDRIEARMVSESKADWFSPRAMMANTRPGMLLMLKSVPL